MIKLLIQALAQLKPGQCGISDHAISLAHELQTNFGIRTAFVILNSTERFNSPFPATYCTPDELLETCASLSRGTFGSLLLHYSGYGFSRDGAPFPLVNAMKSVHGSGYFRTGVYFHELFATGRPWQSAFWYSRRQREVVRRLASHNDMIATNISRHAEWLEREVMIGRTGLLHRIPVFSNIGETAEVPPAVDRLPRLVVFGLPGTRRASYKRLSSFKNVMNELGIEEILDIGPELEVPNNISGIPVRRMGIVTVKDLSGILSRTRFGFVPHPPFCLAKSGVFAGFCAMGTIPFIADPFVGEVDGLRDGVHLVSTNTVKSVLPTGLDKFAAEAWRWYHGHRLRVHADSYARYLVHSLIDDQSRLKGVPSSPRAEFSDEDARDYFDE